MEKCLHVLPMNKLSGAEKMALLICKNLKSYEPIVICGGEVLKKVFEDNGIKAYAVDFSKKNAIKAMKTIRDVIMVNRVKIVHAHDNNASLYSYLAKRIYKVDVKVVSHIHNCYPWLETKGLNKMFDNYIRPRYDFNVTCGSIVFDYYKKNSDSFKSMNVSSLSNAIDTMEIDNFKCSDIEKLKRELGIDSNKVILGYIGRLDDQKGVIPFLEAVAKKKDYFKDCQFLMVGNGSQEDEVKMLIEKYNLKDLFILTGYQADTYKFYSLMDLFFLPSKYEGLPMVILEAMTFQLPIISMEAGSIGELLKDDKGILIQKGNYEEFVEQLIKLKNNETLRKQFSIKGYEFVRENYSIETYVDELEAIYAKGYIEEVV